MHCIACDGCIGVCVFGSDYGHHRCKCKPPTKKEIEAYERRKEEKFSKENPELDALVAQLVDECLEQET